jgi:class 3 adenylate cyclase
MSLSHEIDQFKALQSRAQDIGFYFNPKDDNNTWSHVTLVCFDIVNSTNLSEEINNSHLRKYVEYYHLLCENVFNKYNGTLINTAGDGVIACFGHLSSVEHEAERAIEACYEIMQELSVIDRLFYQRTGYHFYARLGIHSGDVLFHKDDIRQGISGNNVKLATWVEQQAVHNTIVISEDTLSLVKPLYRYRFFKKTMPFEKGKALKLYAIEGRQTKLNDNTIIQPMRGHTEAYGELYQSFLSGISPQDPTYIVGITGQAGLGKTHLSKYLYKSVKDDVNFITLQPISTINRNFLYAVAAFFREEFDFTPQTMAPLTAHLEKIYHTLDENTLNNWIDFLTFYQKDPPRKTLKPEIYLQLILHWINWTVEQKPLVLCLEAFSWKDSLAQYFIRHLRQIHHKSLCCIIINRSLPKDLCLDRIITLKPLSMEDSSFMIKDLSPHLNSKLAQHIASRSDGVPLYIREFTHFVTQTQPDHPDSPIQIPNNIRSVLSIRIDSLGDNRPFVIRAAILGRSFSKTFLRHYMSQYTEDVYEQTIQTLLDEKIFEQSETTLYFSQSLLQEEAYEKLTALQRHLFHYQAALLFLQIDSERYGEIAQHFRHATAYDQASYYFYQSSKRAIQGGQFNWALKQSQHALKLLPQSIDTQTTEHNTIAALQANQQLESFMPGDKTPPIPAAKNLKALLYQTLCQAKSELEGNVWEGVLDIYKEGLNLAKEIENKDLVAYFSKKLCRYYAHTGHPNFGTFSQDFFYQEDDFSLFNRLYSQALLNLWQGETRRATDFFKQALKKLSYTKNTDSFLPSNENSRFDIWCYMCINYIYAGEEDALFKLTDKITWFAHQCQESKPIIKASVLSAIVYQQLNKVSLAEFHYKKAKTHDNIYQFPYWQNKLKILEGWIGCHQNKELGIAALEDGKKFSLDLKAIPDYLWSCLLLSEQYLLDGNILASKRNAKLSLQTIKDKGLYMFEPEALRLLSLTACPEEAEILQNQALLLSQQKGLGLWENKILNLSSTPKEPINLHSINTKSHK